MLNFFKGWKRKAGAVTLVIACVFVSWWVRSVFITDVIRLRERNPFFERYLFDIVSPFSSDAVNVFASDGSSMLWLRRKDRDRSEPFYSIYEANGDVIDRMKPQYDVSNPTVVYIPYSAVVIPLTLLSGYLLLSKPRPAKPNST